MCHISPCSSCSPLLIRPAELQSSRGETSPPHTENTAQLPQGASNAGCHSTPTSSVQIYQINTEMCHRSDCSESSSAGRTSPFLHSGEFSAAHFLKSLNNFGGLSEKAAELLPWVSSAGPLQQRKQVVVLQRYFCREECVTPVSERWLLPTKPLLILRWLLSKSQR